MGDSSGKGRGSVTQKHHIVDDDLAAVMNAAERLMAAKPGDIQPIALMLQVLQITLLVDIAQSLRELAEQP